MPRHPSQPPLKSGRPPDNLSVSSRHPGLTLVGVVFGHLFTRAASCSAPDYVDHGNCRGHNPPARRGEDLRCGDRKVSRQLPGDIKPPGC